MFLGIPLNIILYWGVGSLLAFSLCMYLIWEQGFLTVQDIMKVILLSILSWIMVIGSIIITLYANLDNKIWVRKRR